MEYLKVYVAVIALIDEQGRIKPLSVIFGGSEYVIDEVVDIRRTPPEHVGGLITGRYDCRFGGEVRHIYREETGRWFVELANGNE